MDLDVPNQRIVRGVAGVLSWQPVDGDGEAAEPVDPVTVNVVRADGTTVVTGATATGTGSGPRTVPLTPAQTARLDTLTVTWTDADGSAFTTVVEIAGGFLFTVAEARQSDPKALGDVSKYSTAELVQARLEVEVECEWICARAFVPRYRHVILDASATGELMLPDNQLRALRSVRAYSAPGVYVDYGVDELAAIRVDEHRLIRRPAGFVFDGDAGVAVGYEHGWSQPPPDLKRAALYRLWDKVHTPRSAIADRATSFTQDHGGTYALDSEDAFKTGIPRVDGPYQRYSLRRQAAGDGKDGGGFAPAGRFMQFDPSRSSLFHGGVR